MNTERCEFVSGESSRCNSLAKEAHKYCEEHLERLTRTHVKAIVYRAAVEKLGVEPSDIYEKSSFSNDLGADSLDTIELIMSLEQVFGFSISDEDAEKLSTVGDAIDYVAVHLNQRERYLIDATLVDIDLFTAKAKSQGQYLRRQIQTISASQLFIDYLKRLGITLINMQNILQDTLRENSIEHYSTIPDFDKDGLLLGTGLIVLTRHAVYYYHLSPAKVLFRHILLNHVSLTFDLSFDSSNTISIIKVTCFISERSPTEKYNFAFRGKNPIEETSNFLGKYLSFKENSKHAKENPKS